MSPWTIPNPLNHILYDSKSFKTLRIHALRALYRAQRICRCTLFVHVSVEGSGNIFHEVCAFEARQSFEQLSYADDAYFSDPRSVYRLADRKRCLSASRTYYACIFLV